MKKLMFCLGFFFVDAVSARPVRPLTQKRNHHGYKKIAPQKNLVPSPLIPAPLLLPSLQKKASPMDDLQTKPLPPTQDFHQVDTMHALKDLLSKTSPEEQVFFDIDNTVIHINYQAFKPLPGTCDCFGERLVSSVKKKLTDPTLQKKERDSLIEKVLFFRKNRPVKLMFDEMPKEIKALRDRGVKVYGLTQMDTGQISKANQETWEQWRSKELTDFGIDFTKEAFWEGKVQHDFCLGWATHSSKAPSSCLAPSLAPASFFNGCYYTGSLSKGDVICKIVDACPPDQRPSRIIIVDDRKDHVMDVLKRCEALSIKSTGIVFRGIDQIPFAEIPPEHKEDYEKAIEQNFHECRIQTDKEIMEALQRKNQEKHKIGSPDH